MVDSKSYSTIKEIKDRLAEIKALRKVVTDALKLYLHELFKINNKYHLEYGDDIALVEIRDDIERAEKALDDLFTEELVLNFEVNSREKEEQAQNQPS